MLVYNSVLADACSLHARWSGWSSCSHLSSCSFVDVVYQKRKEEDKREREEKQRKRKNKMHERVDTVAMFHQPRSSAAVLSSCSFINVIYTSRIIKKRGNKRNKRNRRRKRRRREKKRGKVGYSAMCISSCSFVCW